MKTVQFVRSGRLAAVAVLAAALAACDVTENPLALEQAPVVVLGQIASVAQSASAPGPTSPSSALMGIEVSVEGGATLDVTDDRGNFRLEVNEPGERLRIRFRRGSMDVRLELSGAGQGSVMQLVVAIADQGAVLLSSSDSRDDDFEGMASLVSVEGDAPTRTIRVELSHDHRADLIDIAEDGTAFETDGDLLTFDDLLSALDSADMAVEIEGEGEVQDDGSIVATSIKAETHDDDDSIDDDDSADDDDANDDDSDDSSDDSADDDSADDSADDDSTDNDSDDSVDGPGDFEGVATLGTVEGDAPNRTLRIELTDTVGSQAISVVEGVAVFDPLGDLLTFDALLTALDSAGPTVRIEGDGDVQDDGSVVAVSLKAETDDGPDDDGPGDDNAHEGPDDFDGVASFLSVDGDTPARTLRVKIASLQGSWLVDVVEGSTLFDSLGDVLSFGDLVAALGDAALVVSIEGEGESRDDGSIIATNIKVETDDGT